MSCKLLSYFILPFLLFPSSLSHHFLYPEDPRPYRHVAVKDPLDFHYYETSCPDGDDIIRDGVSEAFHNDTAILASLLRLHFLDCFVNGCDASILLDDTKDFEGEKNSIGNISSAGVYQVIDNIKTILEEKCPSTVSCADLLTLAARESVRLAGGPNYNVPLGRRDGLPAPSQKLVMQLLPSSSEPLENIIAKFASKGFDLNDLVALSGAHTIGLASCSAFNGRLYDFKNSGKPDPILASSLALSHFRGMCPSKDPSNTNRAPLDWRSPYRFDNTYYENLVNNSGILESDQALMGDPRTARLVHEYSKSPQLFFDHFASSMVKLSKLGVLTGNKGQIRKNCRFVN